MAAKPASTRTSVVGVTMLASLAVIAIAVDLAAQSRLATSLGFKAVAVGSAVAIVVGLRRYRPARPSCWYWGMAASALFLVGVCARELIAPNPSDTTVIPDVFMLAGYVALGIAATKWLRPVARKYRRDMLLDTGLIGLGAMFGAWTLLISPTLAASPRVDGHTLTNAVYPAIDAVLLAVIAHSVFTSARVDHSLNFVQIAVTAIVLGDIGHALNLARGANLSDEVLAVPYVVGWAAVGIAALHPSMARLTSGERAHEERSRQRATAVALVLLVGALIPAVGSDLGLLDRVMLSLFLGLLLLGVLVRSERAIARSKRSERSAIYRATHDALTGLPNRAALSIVTAPTTARELPLSLLFVDLDGFKVVNDSHGHSVGDELIAQAAARVNGAIRRDDLAIRYGGDEFVVLARLDRSAAAGLAKRLIDTLMEPFDVSAGQVCVSASVGIAYTNATPANANLDDLIRDADTAMYFTKNRARGGFAFYDEALPATTAKLAPTLREASFDDELPRAANQ